MKHVKTKILGLLVVVLLVGGCKKTYKCQIYDPKYLVCNKGADTVRYFASGYDEYMQIIKNRNESNGYTCVYLQNQMTGLTTLDKVEKENVGYLESKGYQCFENN